MIGNLHSARQAIFDALAANTTLCNLIGGATNPRIYQQVAEQDAPFPYVVIRFLPSPDDNKNASADVIMAQPFVDVFAEHDSRSFSKANAISVQIETSLTGLRAVVSGNRIMTAIKRKQITDTIPVNGINHVRDGISYQLL